MVSNSNFRHIHDESDAVVFSDALDSTNHCDVLHFELQADDGVVVHISFDRGLPVGCEIGDFLLCDCGHNIPETKSRSETPLRLRTSRNSLLIRSQNGLDIRSVPGLAFSRIGLLLACDLAGL